MNSVFLDAMETDVEIMTHVNRLAKEQNESQGGRVVDFIHIDPWIDFSVVVTKYWSRLPRLIRTFLIGFDRESTRSDLLSYMLFDGQFTSKLIEVGYEDGLRAKDKIVAMLEG